MTQITFYVGLILLWLTSVSGSLGNAIVLFSILLKAALLPVSISSQKQMDKMKKVQPHLNDLKKKHKDDPKAFQQAQIELLKEHQVNPVGGCIPQLVQLGVLIVLYQVFIHVFSSGEINGQTISMTYLWFDLSKPDPTYLLPIFTGVLQMVLSLMMMSPSVLAESLTTSSSNAAGKKSKKNNSVEVLKQIPEKSGDMADFSSSMQKQMVFILPFMTTFSFIFLKLPSGLALYWTVTSVFSIVQQQYISGSGALPEYWQKAKAVVLRTK